MRSLGLNPDPWQRDVLLSSADRMLMLCARQSGKSTATAVLALHTALFREDSLVLLLSPSLRQSGELYRKVSAFYSDLGRPVAPIQETALTLTLENGSRVVSLPGEHQTIRGFSSPRLIVIDEAAMTSDNLWIALNPMLAVSQGRLVCLSTPLGRRGWFYDLWTGQSGPWHRVKVTARDCPRISPAFLDEQRQTLGERWFNQEYMCSFEDMVGQFFLSSDIEAAFSDDVQPLFGGKYA